MACDARQVLVAACDLCGLNTAQLKAVQIELAREAVLQLSPGTDTSLSAILARAKANGICCLTRNQLRAVTLQLACLIKEAF